MHAVLKDHIDEKVEERRNSLSTLIVTSYWVVYIPLALLLFTSGVHGIRFDWVGYLAVFLAMSTGMSEWGEAKIYSICLYPYRKKLTSYYSAHEAQVLMSNSILNNLSLEAHQFENSATNSSKRKEANRVRAAYDVKFLEALGRSIASDPNQPPTNLVDNLEIEDSEGDLDYQKRANEIIEEIDLL